MIWAIPFSTDIFPFAIKSIAFGKITHSACSITRRCRVSGVSSGTLDIATPSFDLDKVEENRMSWGVFRDRRPEWYGEITRQGRGV